MPREQYSYDDTTGYGKILVTGAAGLVGSELVKQLLDKGFKVVAIYNKTPLSLSHLNLTVRQCDILDTTLLEEIIDGITQVYHCAALVSFDPKEKNRLFKINIEGTENIINACLNANVEKLLHVSSVAALGRKRNEDITERSNWNEETSNSIYAKSKYLGEIEVWRGIGEGLQAVIVNPSIILGGDDWNNGSSALFKSVYSEFEWFTEGTTGFVDVRDVASAMIMLMNSKISGERFILSAENISYKELFSAMAKGFEKKPPSKKATPFLAEIVWRIEALKSLFTGKKKLVTKETARIAQSIVTYNNNKILNAVPGFQFTPIEKSVAFTCATLKAKYHL